MSGTSEQQMENVELVRLQMGNPGDWNEWTLARFREVADRYWAEDIVYEEDPAFPGAGTSHGREAVLEKFGEYWEILGNQRTRVEEISPIDDERVLAVFTHTGLSTGQQAPISHRWAYVYAVRDGRLAHWRAYYDPEEARRELGLDS